MRRKAFAFSPLWQRGSLPSMSLCPRIPSRSVIRSDHFWRGRTSIPVSVIMPALNAGRFIAPAIRSLLAERNAVDLDILVVDDGSTDDTKDIVTSIAGQFPEVRLLQNPRSGIAAARNTGIENVRQGSQFIAFLDADD